MLLSTAALETNGRKTPRRSSFEVPAKTRREGLGYKEMKKTEGTLSNKYVQKIGEQIFGVRSFPDYPIFCECDHELRNHEWVYLENQGNPGLCYCDFCKCKGFVPIPCNCGHGLEEHPEEWRPCTPKSEIEAYNRQLPEEDRNYSEWGCYHEFPCKPKTSCNVKGCNCDKFVSLDVGATTE